MLTGLREEGKLSRGILFTPVSRRIGCCGPKSKSEPLIFQGEGDFSNLPFFILLSLHSPNLLQVLSDPGKWEGFPDGWGPPSSGQSQGGFPVWPWVPSGGQFPEYLYSGPVEHPQTPLPGWGEQLPACSLLDRCLWNDGRRVGCHTKWGVLGKQRWKPNSFLHPHGSHFLLQSPVFTLPTLGGFLPFALLYIFFLLSILGSHVFSFPLWILPSINLLKV